MKLILNVLLLAGITSLLFSCGSDDENSPNVDVTFMAEGAEYHYYTRSFFGDDTVKSIIEKQIGKDTFLVRNYSDLITVFPTQYWVLKNGNFYSSFRLRDPDAYYIECKFGKPKGTSWNVKRGSVDFTYTIDEVNVSITTGQGEITDAVKVRVKTGSNVFYQYVSPTVGLIGTGDFEDEDASMYLVKHFPGTPGTTDNVVPAITYGDFPFMEVGNYWTYYESTFFGEDEVTVTIETKLPSKNIYKVNITYASGGESDGYWYEDNGYLMTYDEGEEIVEADPIYLHPSQAELEYGWGSLTGSGTLFIYEIESLDESIETYYGALSSMGIGVTDGLFSSQTNYWNLNKGNVLVSGFVSRDVIASNVRRAQGGFIPILAPQN